MQSSVLINNVTLVTPTRKNGLSILPNTHVSISNGIIRYVGQDIAAARNSLTHKHLVPDLTTREDSNDIATDVTIAGTASSSANIVASDDYEEYSGSDRILLPTFANGHSHIPMSIMKNTADDMNLEDWLFKVILPREQKLIRSDIYHASLLGIAEMINGGIGASADMYFMSEETARAALDSGFRLNLCHDGKILEHDEWRTDYNGLENFRKQFHLSGNGLLRVSLMIHSIYLYPEFLYPQLAEAAASCDVSIQLHLSETRTEVDNCYARYGKSPAEAFAEFGIFDRPCIAAHGVHLSDNDRDILRDHKVTVAHNPTSNLKLASGICDVKSLLNKGINVCIGTDGSASNNSLDIYSEMKIASLIAKEMYRDPENMKAKDTLFIATRGGYAGMGFADCGIIEPGMSADLQLVRCDNPSVWPVGNPISALVYGTPSSAVESVMIAGRFVKYRGELTTIDFERVKAESMLSARRITAG